MEKHAIWHQAKSHLSYAYDQKTLHILLQTASSDSLEVNLISGDPFLWGHVGDTFTWIHHMSSMRLAYETELFKYYMIDIQPDFKRTKYGFIIKEGEKSYFYGTEGLLDKTNKPLFETYDLSQYFNFPFINHEDVMDTPSWAKNMVWYQIFPDRFYTETPQVDWHTEKVINHTRFGGDIQGIIKQLPYLKSLGIQGIYFTPMFKASSMHKYDTTDYFLIDPDFGSNEDFKMLVSESHKQNIKVMLDGVFNHCGFFHPYFQDVIKHGENSIYKDCFFIREFPVINFKLNEKGYPIDYKNTPKHYDTFAFTPMMPKWNTSNPIAAKHLLDVVSYWIKHYDIDGWRLDVSNEISHDFLRQIRHTARHIKKDIFILGENWDASLPWLLGDQLDAVMNYDLTRPIWNLLDHIISPQTFIHQLHAYLARTPKHVIDAMFNLVGTHDTIRVKRRFKDNPLKTQLAYALMFIQAGSPNIYYGDEIGLTGEHDPDNRRPMIWDEKHQDHDMLHFMKQLIHLKQTQETFNVYDIHLKHDPNLLILEKFSGNESLIVIANITNHQVEIPKYIQNYTIVLKTCHDVLEPYTLLIGVTHEINHS